METELLGWPEDEPTLSLDYRTFSYAGKFVMSNTGKAVCRENGAVVGAVAFNEDRTQRDRLWLRYVTVHEEYRGRGIAPQLVTFVLGEAASRGYATVRIAVNNPYAYQALQKAGFRFTGETTGIAELVLERPTNEVPPPDPDRYREGIELFEERELTEEEVAFLQTARTSGPPGVLDQS
jgi:ribosomal protein S18 acetylase RimI-like enzyme